MRLVVLDTNVIVSAGINARGAPAAIVLEGVFVKTADGTGVTGTLAVVITPATGAKVTCAYTITMK